MCSCILFDFLSCVFTNKLAYYQILFIDIIRPEGD